MTKELGFSNEELLRGALLGLLRRMPNVSGPNPAHGPGELGKDLLFQSTGPLREAVNCAVVAKNQRITGSVTSSSGARNVLHQCRQVLDAGLLNPRGEVVHVQNVYVMCPHEISQTALNSIRGALELQSGHVTFIC